jgi:hypothetical protein
VKAFFGTLATIVFLTSPAYAVCLFGMGNCAPAESDGAKLFQQIVAKAINQPANWRAHFQKTNGTSSSRGGPERYAMEYTAAIEFESDLIPANFDWCGKYLGSGDCQQRGEILLQFVPANLMQSTAPLRPNKVTVRGYLMFLRTEQGWRYAPDLGL